MENITFVTDNIEPSPLDVYGSIQIRSMMLLSHVCVQVILHI